MRILGLTGGICSGKSEAARRFAARGIPCIDADALAHALIAPGGEAEEAVCEAFGPGILTDGKIDRKKLGALVFADSEARLRINDLLHPLVAKKVADQCAALNQQGYEIVIVEAALLAERGQRKPWLDGLILVLCAEEIRIRRLIELRAMTAEEACRRIQSQAPPESKIPLADWTIENDDTLEGFLARVDAVIDEILQARNAP